MDAKFFSMKQAYEGVIKEDRQEDIPYTNIKAGSKKEAMPGDEIGAVIASLSEQKASYASKIANEFLEIKEKKEKIDAELEDMKGKLQDLDKSYFDAKDMVINRIIQTATLSLKFAKIAADSFEKTEKTDVAKVKKAFEKINALILAQLPSLKDELDKIMKETIDVKEEVKKGSWRVPTIQKEALEDVANSSKKLLKYLKDAGRKMKEQIYTWAIGFDKKNNEIEDALDEVQDELGLEPVVA